jgi:hypothetical protein
MTYDPYTWPELALEIAAILNIFPSNLNDWSVLLNSTCSVVQELYKLNGSTSVEYLQSFPNPCTIPPTSFFNQQGIAGWLEQNPIFKLAFSFTETFKFLYPPSYAIIFSTFGVPGYNPLNVPLCGNVTTLSQIQARKYNQQLQLFQKVYSTNSNAYITYLNTGQGPIYYTFASNQERSDMSSAVALVNKLYYFKDMSQACGWQIPFPLS